MDAAGISYSTGGTGGTGSAYVAGVGGTEYPFSDAARAARLYCVHMSSGPLWMFGVSNAVDLVCVESERDMS